MLTEKYTKILLATDLSEDCRNAYTYAVNLAAACNGRITLLHVIDPRPISSFLETRINNLLGQGSYQEIMQNWENDARSVLIGKRKEVDIIREALTKFRAALSRFSDVIENSNTDTPLPDDEILVKKGEIVEQIVAAAMEEEADQIILAAHSHASRDAFVSKTIQGVLNLVHIPVTIIPPVRIQVDQ
jgi:nucleotide-binding universal stress UspA family protein